MRNFDHIVKDYRSYPEEQQKLGEKTEVKPFEKLIAMILIISVTLLMSIVISRKADTHFCIIQTRESEPFLKNIKIHFESLSQQTYQNFEIVYHLKTDGEIESYKKVAEQILPGKSRILKSLDNINKDVYEASTQKCPQDSLIVFLNEDEEFYEKDSLEQLEREIRADGSMAVLTPFLHQGKKISPDQELIHFQRDGYFNVMNKPRTELDQIHNLTRHMRVFRWELYRSIMPTNFHGDNDTWYRSKAAFQLPLLELTKEASHDNDVVRSQPKRLWDLPNLATILSFPLFTSQSMNDVDYYDADVNEFNQNHRVVPPGHSVEYALRGSCRYPKFYSERSKSLNYLNRLTFNKPLIPRTIHQVWLGHDIPPFKQNYMNRFADLMPEWEHRIWGYEDITRQNFPILYDYLIRILRTVKETKQNRFAQMADLMRMEILYNHGGFYSDSNIQPFKSYEPLRNYSFVIFSMENQRNEDYIENSFYASEPGSYILKRALQKEVLDYVDYASWHVNFESGPTILARAFDYEDYYLRSKVLPTHKIFSHLSKWDRRAHTHRCQINNNQGLDHPRDQYNFTYTHNSMDMIFPCSSMYPTSFAIDHLYFGGTWYKNIFKQVPRWLVEFKFEQ